MAEIVLFTSNEGAVALDVNVENETVWLNRHQLASLFDRDIKTIGKHINNALNEELAGEVVVAKFATTTRHGAVEGKMQTHMTDFYNLDVVLSVGYRVKSKRGVEFRRWANTVLKDYILKGYAVNNRRLQQLGQLIQVMKRAEGMLDAKGVLSVIERYHGALDLLDDYDHQRLKRPEGTAASYQLTYEECRQFIDQMKFASESPLFGNEKDESFKGSLGAIYQTFGGREVYPTVEEKAANLLYFLVKNHSFSDGNKRIAAALFLYFLDKNNCLFTGETKRISDQTLVALTILTAESRAGEKEMMVSVIINCMQEGAAA